MALPASLEIIPLDRSPSAAVQVPGSKSITNRALVLAALWAKGFAYALRGALRSEDTEVMIEALRSLGFRVLTEWPEAAVFVSSDEDEPTIPAREADLFVANSGTTMRFVTALVSLGNGRYRLDGAPRMRQRPIQDLLDALGQLGVTAYSENENQCPPVVVLGRGLEGGRVRIKGDISSQFLSGLLMVTPFARASGYHRGGGPPGIRALRRDDRADASRLGPDRAERGRRPLPVSRTRGGTPPHFAQSNRQARAFQEYDPRRDLWVREYQVEPDASAASYFLAAAAITGGRVTVQDLPQNSLQGDVRFVDVLAEMGCRVEHCSAGVTIHGRPLHGIDVDMNDISDTVMTMAAVACFARGPTTIRNVAHIRHKETNRLAALATELRRVGAGVEEFDDGLTITPGPLHGARLETYNDHRMAMSMALLGLRVPGIILQNPACVAKTYPGFFDDLEKLRK